jgi:hypothetical protein
MDLVPPNGCFLHLDFVSGISQCGSQSGRCLCSACSAAARTPWILKKREINILYSCYSPGRPKCSIRPGDVAFPKFYIGAAIWSGLGLPCWRHAICCWQKTLLLCSYPAASLRERIYRRILGVTLLVPANNALSSYRLEDCYLFTCVHQYSGI